MFLINQREIGIIMDNEKPRFRIELQAKTDYISDEIFFL